MTIAKLLKAAPSIAVFAWFAASGSCPAQDEKKPAAPKEEVKDETKEVLKDQVDPTANLPRLTLGECLAIAYDRQPAIRAAFHSYNAVMSGDRALYNLPSIAERVAPDLPIRKEQSKRGLLVATAEISKIRQETTQDVIVLYYSYVYAKQQEQTAGDVLEQMEIYYEVAEGMVKSGARVPGMKLNQFSLYALQNVIAEVRAQKLKAGTGSKLAIEAIKDTMGVDPSFVFLPAAKQLPEMLTGTVTLEQVMAESLNRRPELMMAAAGVDAFRLEVCAQAKIKYKFTVPTLGAGSDLHSKQLPIAVRNGDYRPGPIVPEMPTTLVGKTADRVAKATELSLRQDALYERAVSLIRLEAANAFLKWEAASIRVREAKIRFDRGRRMVEESRSAAVAKQDAELLVTNEALAGKAQAEYVEAVYEHIKTLAALERVTGGGILAQFPER